jgi:N-acetylglucosamine malate deacetylase 1
MNPYENYVAEFSRIVREGKNLPLGGLPLPSPKPSPPDAPRVLIFAPHPDDEVIIGGLPLRLLRELEWKVINVAVTQGSSKSRQQERWRELQACCDYIGFDLLAAAPNGLEGINPETRAKKPQDWARSVNRIAEILIASPKF